VIKNRPFCVKLVLVEKKRSFKDSVHDAIIWADAMQQFIEKNYELI